MSDIVHLAEHDLVCWYPTGTLDLEKTIAYYRRLAAMPDGHTVDRYCDFSGIEQFVMDFTRMSRLVAERGTLLAGHTEVKIGIYCPDEVGYAFCRMFEELMEGRGAEVLTSRDLGDVADFLGVDEPELCGARPAPGTPLS